MRLRRQRRVREGPRERSLAAFAAELATDHDLRERYRSDPIGTMDENGVVLILNHIEVLATLPDANLDDAQALLQVLRFIEENA